LVGPKTAVILFKLVSINCVWFLLAHYI